MDLSKTIRDLVFEVVVKQVIARAVALAPWLAWPVINPVFVFVVSKLFGVIYDEMSLTVSFVVIDFRHAHHRAAYDRAVADLKDAQESGNNEEIESAKAEFRSTLRDLIRVRPR